MKKKKTEKFGEATKGIGVLKKLSKIIPRQSLFTMYKSFITPYLDYGNIIYNHCISLSFHEKLESVQYTSALAITGAERGTRKGTLYDELGLKSRWFRRWFRRVACFYKMQ